jgi:phosphonate transport system permease protein
MVQRTASGDRPATQTGGLGLLLESSLSVLAWPQVSMILLVILGTVLLSEWLSAKVRHAII